MVLKSHFPDMVIPKEPVGQYVMREMQKYGNAVALVNAKTGMQLTYREVHEKALEYTKILWLAGLRKGDVVGLVLPFDVQYAPLLLAIANCGAVIFGCKLLYKLSILNQLTAMKPCIVITSDDWYGEISTGIMEKVSTVKVCCNFEELHDLDPQSLKTLEQNLPDYGSINVEKDPIAIFQSSGTTGAPKGILTSHFGIMTGIMQTTQCLNLPVCGETYCTFISALHLINVLFVFSSLSSGMRLAYLPSPEAQDFFDFVTNFDISRCLITNVKLFREILKEKVLPKHDLSSLETILVGGTTFPPRLIQEARNKFNALVTMAIGSTECGFFAMSHSKKSPVSSVGCLLPNVKIKVMDIDTGKELGCDQKGELWVQSDALMIGYINSEALADDMTDGWFHTGDMVCYDENGYLYVVGRIKDVIKMYPSCVNVLPAEIENVLLLCDRIEDAAVIGIAHPDKGEAAKAYIVKKDDSLTEEEVLEFFKAEVKSELYLDGGIEFIDDIPKTGIGKPLRRLLLKRHLKTNS